MRIATAADAIATLGGPETDPVVDFLADPGGACRALDAVPEHGGIVVRVAGEGGSAAPGYGPTPGAPLWIRVMRGAREVGTAKLHDGDGMVRRAVRVELEERSERCCDAPGCERMRTCSAAWLVLEPVPEASAPERLLVAEQRAQAGESLAPVGVAPAVATRLAAALGVPLQRGGADLEIPRPLVDPPAPLGAGLAVAALARFALASEGERVVVRDWESAGPRASAGRNAWIGGAFMVLAALGWAQLWRAVDAGGAAGVAIASGVAAALLTLAGYAFLGVARFSAKYRATSAPLLAVGRDRLIVLPWVSRDGAVDARAEGRLGAAIPLGEVRGATPAPRASGVAVELDTDHGRIDAMVCPSAAAAELWCAVIDRVVDEARHPRQGASARQRARQRAAATA